VQDTPKILDFGDMDSQKWLEYARYKPFPLSLGYGWEGMKLLAEEKRLARRFDLCTATTRAEWETFKSYGIDTPSDWFPNGVDSEYFAPAEGPYDPDTMSFVGRMDYYPNQECMFDFCARTWPLLRQARPGLTLYIVGADPSPKVRRLGELPGVVVTGSVPDVRPYRRRSALMVAPLNIARGTQNKILEAMAMGIPVVTSRVAAGGVDAVDGEHFLVAETPEQYLRTILRVLGDPAERGRLAAAGRARMLSHHAWGPSMKRLDGIIARCLARPRAAAPFTEHRVAQ
jgi:sugar transferase (PEP-CTERM/EpsH1 system associated)